MRAFCSLSAKLPKQEPMATPGEWYWSFQPEGAQLIHGIARSRPLAVVAAKQAIDRYIKVKSQSRDAPVQDSRWP